MDVERGQHALHSDQRFVNETKNGTNYDKGRSETVDCVDDSENSETTTASVTLSPPAEKEGMIRRHFALIKSSPCVLAAPLVVFLILLGTGVALVLTVASREQQTLHDEAYLLAMETSTVFEDQLKLATMPLFTLAQFVHQLGDPFGSLPDSIGVADGAGSLPLLPPARTHRNITGVCDDPDLVQRFESIAAGIKKDANMQGVLVNIQLAPQAVVCLLHPVNNTEDFEDGIFMDNTGAIGHDLLSDPLRHVIALQTLESDGLVVAGPLTLRQCSDCDPTVEKAFIARLPIDRPVNHEVSANASHTAITERWGMAVALINWNVLVERANAKALFKERNWEFQLTRTDLIVEQDTGEIISKVEVLASSDDFDSHANSHHRLTVGLETTNNEWEMTVAYCPRDNWRSFAILSTVLLSILVGGLVYLLLAEKQRRSFLIAFQSQQLLAQARRAAQDERDLNDFIAHEVRNPLSAALSACSFVSTSVNEREPLNTDESRTCVREDVSIIEKSLMFINDLLRSMLDIHRATSKQLELDLSETDVLRDVLEPVSAMLYRRDEVFTVKVECTPETLIVMTDRLRLQQVVLNLGRNAAKFVTSGYVCLRAYVDADDGNVHIAVEDTGPGLPLEKRAHLFDRFQQSLDLQSQGTGIGLNLCKILMEAMGGDIALDESYTSGIEGHPGTRILLDLKVKNLHIMTSCTIGTGKPGDSNSHFSIEVPILSEPPTEILNEMPDLPSKCRLLLVDDERILRKLASRSILKIRPEWEIREAASGETALQVVQEEEPFDLILMDQYMTSTDRSLTGTETIRKLRADGCKAIICGLSANDLAPSFKKAGANHFLMKPFPCKSEELRKELDNLLAGAEGSV